MEQSIEFQNKKIRYFTFKDSVIFNASDICKILNIEPSKENSDISQKDMDQATVLLHASGSNLEFFEFITSNFSKFALKANIRPSDLNW